ncbi:glycoside hydrolase family 3 N-terminal domain-containing protein [Carboxylicivirga sp. M1479]|uniref:glycoside hydrolase family 3 N-terminal domain-containing protein n=1 Tax=Carboxylicivirga sp. M1479 TaxID=2594476 RepID=UPI001177E5BE|nr:glycoside hydrolase family 3 N-terminal domain-containing protein [Carboxylicivirga sp. M1479]TRX65713.1 beta-glucosidase [Carboxylicivirga sp. M1479]
MKKALIIVAVISLTTSFFSCQQEEATSPYEEQIETLLAKMTIEEKVGQTAQFTLDVVGEGENVYSSHFPFKLDEVMLNDVLVNRKTGSILNTATNTPLSLEEWHAVVSRIQEVAIEATGIPVIYGIDAIHGTTYTQKATFLPQQIGQAATFNRELVRKGAENTAYETRASNLPWNFSPVLDLGRNAAWPRIWETFGEDVYLISELGEEVIRGYQGTNKDELDKQHVAACLKHYMGYGTPVNGKDRTPANIPLQELIEKHYEPFVRAVEAGALTVMANSGIVNGESVHASYKLLTKMLKQDLNFDGVIVTDWQDINNLYARDRIAKSDKEAIKIAINAGIDMAMVPYDIDYTDYFIELVNEGEIPMSRLDDAVRRILRLKYRLGLFENPVFDYKAYDKFAGSEHKADARLTAEESITLLKNNNNILPLSANQKVLVTGPNAHSMRTLQGGWTLSWQGEKVEQFIENKNTFLTSIKQHAKNVVYVPGVSYKMDGPYWEEKDINIAEAVKAAQNVDVIVACVGENTYTEKPGDLNDLSLSQNQQDLVKALAKTGKPVVLVLNEGRPRTIPHIEPLAQAIVQTYLPGTFGGEVTADILFGKTNPSGKLPYTYPKHPNSLMTYDYKPAENRTEMEGAYNYGAVQDLQYGFGHGLSYTTFTYSNLKVDKANFTAADVLTFSVDVTNTGERTGKETVLLFSSDLYASISPDNRRLKGFDKIELQANETKTVQLKVKASDLAFVNLKGDWVLEQGEFKVQVGSEVVMINATENGSWTNAFR